MDELYLPITTRTFLCVRTPFWSGFKAVDLAIMVEKAGTILRESPSRHPSRDTSLQRYPSDE